MDTFETRLKAESDFEMCQGVLAALVTHEDLGRLSTGELQSCLLILDEKIESLKAVFYQSAA